MRPFLHLLLVLLLALGTSPIVKVHADPVYQSQAYACPKSATATGSAQVLVASAGTLGNGAKPQIYVCGFIFAGAGTTPTATLFYAATGTSCASSLASVIPVITLTAGSAVVDHQTFYAGLPPVPNGDDLCGTTTGTGTQIIVYYTQF